MSVALIGLAAILAGLALGDYTARGFSFDFVLLCSLAACSAAGAVGAGI